MDRKRDPKGIPTGGRFAEDRKAEVDIDLANETAANIVAGFVQTGRATLGADGEVIDYTPEPSEEDLELARDQLGLSASEDDVHSLAASWAADFAAEQDEGSTPTIASTLEEQGEIALDSSEHGDDVFEMVQVHSVGEIEEGMVTVTGNVFLNVEDGLAPYMPDFSGEDDPEVLVNAWLEDRAPLISTWMEERYGAQDENADDWDHQTYEFAVNVPDTTPIDRLTTVLREKTKALTFYNESDHGSFGHENMFDALSTHLAEKDREAESVAAGYIERLINTSDEISGKENGITPSSVAVAVDDARMFMHRNRDTVARVLADVDGARPLGYAITEAHIGDWLAGARAGEATPLDMLGEDGARLRESAESERARTVSIDDDGNIRLPLS